MTDVKAAVIVMTLIGYSALAVGLILAYAIGTGTHAEPARTLLTAGLVGAMVGSLTLLGIYTYPKDDRKDRR